MGKHHCKTCDGKGWRVWVYPHKKPVPAYWFERGPNGERPKECEDCNSLDEG